MTKRLRSLAWYWFAKGFAASRKATDEELRAAFDKLWRSIKESSERGKKQ